MNKLYLLPNHEIINTPFVWIVTPSCYQNVRDYLLERNYNLTAHEFLRRCFSDNKYLCTAYRAKSTGRIRLNIFIWNTVYSCSQSEDLKSFLLTGFRAEEPIDVTNSIHKGVYLEGTNSILKITLNRPIEIKTYYFNGIEKDYRDVVNYSSDTFSVQNIVAEKSEELDAKRQNILLNKDSLFSSDSKQKISDSFNEYLSLAESYAQYEDEAAATAARASEGISCRTPMAIDDYDRQDKVAYSYIINGNYDEIVYRIGTKIEIDITEQRKISATIIGFGNTEESRTIQLLFDEIINFNDLPSMTIIHLSYSKIMYEIQQDVIDSLRENRSRANYLDSCIGMHIPEKYSVLDLEALENKLNNPPEGQFPPTDSQLQAIKKGISAKDIMLVQGPPGTGKTTVILEWVKYFCKELNYRVLISSQNNKAVDNVLERIAEENGIEAIRAGNETKIQKNLYPLLLENKLGSFRDDVSNQILSNKKKIDFLIDYLQDEMIPKYTRLYSVFKEYQNSFEEYQRVYTFVIGDMPSIGKKYSLSSDKLKADADIIINEIGKTAEKSRKTKNPIINFFLKRKLKKLYDRYSNIYEEYISLENTYFTNLCAMINRLKKSRLQERELLEQKNSSQIKKILETLEETNINGFPFVRNDLFEQPEKIISTDFIRDKLQTINHEVTRLSNERTLLKDWENVILGQNNYALSDALLESVNLVGATCIGINSQRKFANMNFDITIIDEAGQIQIHNALVPMSRSPKLIMLGDHKQIPPLASDYVLQRCEEDGVDDRLERISLFEDLYERLPDSNKVLLDTQFRMPAEIADLLSEWFYEGKYKSFSGKRNMKSIFPELFESCFVIVDTGHIKDKNEKKTTGYINVCEAEIVRNIVKTLVSKNNSNHIDARKIGVISPYGDQIKLLISKLKGLPEIGNNASEIAATLDSFQGQERDVIIYSCTRSNTRPKNARGRIGFLTELRRLNVALSRPKKMLIFIGDIEFLSSCTFGEGANNPKEFSDFIRLMKQKVIDGNGQYIYAEKLIDRIGDIDYE